MPPESPVRKVLIYRLGSLGDTVVALPCFHLIARTFPKAERVLLTNFPVHSKAPASAAVLGDSDLVHRYMRYTVGTRRIDELIRLVWQIRRFRPDVLIYLMPPRPVKNVRRDRIFFRVAGVPRFIGLPGDDEIKYRFDAATGMYEAEASRLTRTIADLGNAHPENIANWNLRLNVSESATAVLALSKLGGKPVIACAPGCKMQAKEWEKENWRALIARLYRKYPSYSLVLAGAREDAEVCDYAALDWQGAKLNLAGSLTPRESAAVFSHATVFIGADSGPMHLAAAVGVPCVCAFSAHSLPGVWFPAGDHNQIIYHQTECFGCGLETCIVMEKKCIRSITVDEMDQAVDRVLSVLK